MSKQTPAQKELARRAKVALAQRHLIDYACYTDPKAAKNYRAAHLQLLAKKLEAVESGECKRLMVFMPNRHWKSSLISIKFVQWFIAKRFTEDKPHQTIITSFGATLAEEMSATSRDVVRGDMTGQDVDLFHEIWPKVRLASNRQSAMAWGLKKADSELDEAYPCCMAAGVGGGITGKGADLFIIDDPVKNAAEAQSVATQNAQWQWFVTTARTRLNPNGAIVIAMTRWDTNDLAGQLLAIAAEDPMADQWEVLVLPALAYTPEERDTARRLGIPVPDEDPLGRQPGEALWKEKYPAHVHLQTKAMDLYAFSSIAQQMPRQPGGFLMGRQDFAMLDTEPEADVLWVWGTDVAITEKQITPKGNHDPDYAVAFKVGLWTPGGNAHDARIVLAYMRRKQTQNPKELFKECLLMTGPTVPMYGAQDNLDKVIFNDLRADAALVHYSINTLPKIAGDKVTRSAPWRNRVETGRVYVVRGPWNEAFFEEAEGFPKMAHDDQIDAVSVGVHALGIRAGGVSYMPNIFDLDAGQVMQMQQLAGVMA